MSEHHNTLGEIIYQSLKERHERFVAEYIAAKPGELAEAYDLLKSRLFMLGFRGSELKTELEIAVLKRKEKQIT